MIALGKVWLALGLIGFAATSWAAETHRVVAIAGSRYEPSDMAIDQALSKGTLVHAEKDTLIVLRKSWPVDSGYDHQNTCHEWIVVRDNTFRVDDENPRPCPTGGDPGALTVAMNQQRKLSRYVVLGGVSERGDDPIPEAPEFMDALYELHEQGLPAPAPPEYGSEHSLAQCPICPHRLHRSAPRPPFSPAFCAQFLA